MQLHKEPQSSPFAANVLPRSLGTGRAGRSSRWLGVLCVALMGCQGTIDSSDPSNGAGAAASGPGAGNPAGGPGGGVASGGASSGNAGGSNTSAGTNAGVSGSGGVVSRTQDLDAGRSVLRRLNRYEYNNTVQDLLGTSATPGSRFPGDDISVDGFDTIGLDLNFTGLHALQAEMAATELVAELMARPMTDPHRRRWLVCEPTAQNADVCVREILNGFLLHAYRRPPLVEEVEDLVKLSSEIRSAGGTPQDGLRAALKVALLSPHFLYRVELDPNPKSNEVHRVNDYELATRLAYFVWASTPDAALLDAAGRGALTQDPAELGRQFERLVQDPKSERFLKHFASMWLSTEETEEVAPASVVFPAFDDTLRTSMRSETESFFKALVRDALPLETLLLADFTFADERLARHYGLPAAATTMQKVSLAGTPRVGLLTQTSFLSITSFPDRTSPVRRGGWVIEKLLCTPPPPPPPEAQISIDAPAPGENATLREKLEAHRAAPECAGCHALFDPIGFGLENFDAIGSYRTQDNNRPVDATGVTIDGSPFNGARELATLLAKDPRFVPCVAQQLLTYSVGRSFRAADAKGYTAALAETIRAGGGTWLDALQVVVNSEAFLTRRGEAL